MKTDSLNTVLLNAKHDTTRVNIYIQLGQEYIKDTTQAFNYAKKAFDLSKQAKFIDGQAKAQRLYATTYSQIPDYPKSRYYFIKSLSLFEKTQNNSGIADVLNNIGSTYLNQNQFDSANYYSEKSLQFSEKYLLLKSMAGSYSNLGLILFKKQEYDSSVHFFRKAFESYDKSGNQLLAAQNLETIGRIYEITGKYDTAISTYNEALEYNTRSGNYTQVVFDLNKIGLISNVAGNFPKAVETFKEAISITLEKKLNKIYDLYNNLALIYQNQGLYTIALENLQMALNTLDTTSSAESKINILLNMGITHNALNNLDNALDYFEKGRSLAEESHDYAKFYGIYSLFDIIYSKKGEIDKQVANSKMALKYGEEHNIKTYISLFLNNLGDAYLKLGKTQLAVETLTESLNHARQANSTYDIALALTSLAEAHMKKGDYNTALNFAIESMAIRKQSGSLSDLEYTHKLLSDLYYKMGKYKLAYDHFSAFKVLNDSVFNTENVKKITALEMQHSFDQEKKIIEIEEQKKDEIHKDQLAYQKTIRNFLFAGFALLILLIFFVYRSYKIKQIANQKLTVQNNLISNQKEEIQTQAEELKITNEKLVELDQFKEGMTGMIVHDLKNPLNSIINTRKSSPEAQISSMKDSGKQMLNLVLNILDVYKYENTQMTIYASEHSLSEIIMNSVTDVSFLAEQKSITIAYKIPENMNVKADKEIIERVFVNILTNAIKYTPNNGEITIGTGKKDDKNIKIEITDNGQGIPKDKIHRVFEKFGQVAEKSSGKVRSTGLGLTFCKMAVESHGGEIGVESEVGKGTTFWFSLPGDYIVGSEKYIKVLSPGKDNIEFSEADKDILKPHLNNLQKLMVYEVTEIHEILNKVKSTDSDSIKRWKEQIEQAIFSMNEEKYAQLIDINNYN